ncbi:phosphoribosylglycinamide formyltransferase 2 [Bordetella pertussis]|nr:phosphoribosylglycinamide formyltransferase 2 [Bordetella pertussis]
MGVGLAVADDVDQARAKAARVSQAVRVFQSGSRNSSHP